MDYLNSRCYFTLFIGKIKNQGDFYSGRKASKLTASSGFNLIDLRFIGLINIKSNVDKIKLVCRMQICPFSPYNLRLKNITYSCFFL